jgi:prepilin-type N-terminal cleavage/methylation domain-containing protein
MKKGFTLIELLVVISIISLLSSIVLSSLNQARASARDSERLSDIRQIQVALELYRNINGNYPGTPVSYGENYAPESTWDASYVDSDNDGIFFIDPLVEGGFLSADIKDPINNSEYSYVFYSFINGGLSGSCPEPLYLLRIKKFETYSNPHPQNPGRTALTNCIGSNYISNNEGWVVMTR